MKRSGLFGRAPVVHDLTAAFTIYGFLDQSPSAELAANRARLFAEVKSSHHYSERREVVDRVSDDALLQTHGEIQDQYNADWRKLFNP